MSKVKQLKNTDIKEQNTIWRKGRLEDLTELQKLFVESVKSVCSADYNAEQIKIWTSSVENIKRWKDIMTYQAVIVAEFNNQIVGFTSLANFNYVDLMYVHKDFQKQGIAKRLYAVIEDIAKENKQTVLTSDVSKTARPFFSKMGFSVVKEQTVIRKGIELTNFKMTKTLTEI